jgi:Sulfotransferase domain
MTSSRGQRGLREWAAQVVQWNPARNAIKYGVVGFAHVRGGWYQRTGKLPEVANIITACLPKAGSQWMKALMAHPVIGAHTGLFTLPELEFQHYVKRRRPFPAGTVVPGFGWSYEEYLQIPKPLPQRLIYMFRDPRDMVVSGYYSAVKTHRKLNSSELENYREKLRKMPFDDALLDIIASSRPMLETVTSWVDAQDESVAKFRLEDVAADPRQQVTRMLAHCGVGLSEDELDTVLREVSRDSLQARDLARRKDGESHYRVDRKTFRDLFKPEHHQALESQAPGLLAQMGYAD